MTDQIRWTVTLPHDRWLMVGEHGCSPRNATSEDVELAGYVPAAEVAGERERVRELEGLLVSAEAQTTLAGRERDEARAQTKMFGGVMEKVEADRDRWYLRMQQAESRVAEFVTGSKQNTRRKDVAKALGGYNITKASDAPIWPVLLADIESKVAEADSIRAKLATAEREREQWRITADDSIATAQDLRAKLAEAEHTSENWRSRIATAVGAVHEWDYGSAPGTWEEIEDKAASDRKQADATLDEMIMHRDECERLRTRYAALESAVRDWRMEQASIPEGAAAKRLYAPTPAPSAPKPETCGECADAGTNRCEAPGRKGDDRACDKATRRLPVVAETKPRAPYKTCGDCAELQIAFGGVRGTCGAQHGRNGDSVFTSTAACSAFCGKPRPAAQGVE